MQITLERLLEIVEAYNNNLTEGEALMTLAEMAEIMECEIHEGK